MPVLTPGLAPIIASACDRVNELGPPYDDAADPKPLPRWCWKRDDWLTFGSPTFKAADRLVVLAELFAFLQMDGAFEWSKSKYSSLPSCLMFDALADIDAIPGLLKFLGNVLAKASALRSGWNSMSLDVRESVAGPLRRKELVSNICGGCNWNRFG